MSKSLSVAIGKGNIHDDLTYKIIGCAMAVHSTLGNGFQEVIYQQALAIELKKKGDRLPARS